MPKFTFGRSKLATLKEKNNAHASKVRNGGGGDREHKTFFDGSQHSFFREPPKGCIISYFDRIRNFTRFSFSESHDNHNSNYSGMPFI